MKRVGIDYGSKKIGIALTDDGGTMAFPHEVVPNDGNFVEYLDKLIQEYKVEEIVVGHSLNNQGDPNKIHSAVEEFIMDATLAIGLPIHLQPEQYSSQQAMHIQGRNKQIDAAAAAIILDSFITKKP